MYIKYICIQGKVLVHHVVAPGERMSNYVHVHDKNGFSVFLYLQIKRNGDSWMLVGAVDMGSLCSNIDTLINQKKEAKLATHVMQLVFNGFTGFRWPVAYFATSTATAHQLYLNIWEAVDVLDDYGFQVDYVMMDGASTNRAFTKMVLGNQRSERYRANNVFDQTETVTFTQDIKHTFKKIRNGIESSRKSNKSADKGRCLLYDGQHIVWDHWMAAGEFNNQGGFRIHKRLTQEHIELTSTSKM